MSVLVGPKIIEEIKNGKINIEPFNESYVGPNSVDVTLSNKLLTYVPCMIKKDQSGNNIISKIESENKIFNYLDMAKDNKVYELQIPDDGLILIPGILYLGSTNEKAGSDYYIPMYEGRSSMARLGIQSHLSAGFGDIFFKSNWTLEITVIHNIKIYPNSRFGQVYFYYVPESDRQKLIKQKMFYKGKYVNQTEPQKSKSYLDFDS